MVTRGKEIYKRVAAKHKIDLSLVESIGNAMFQELRNKVDTGTSLAYEMPKLGTFNIRFTRFLQMFNGFNKHLEQEAPWALELLEQHKERYERDKLINTLIAAYRQDKKDVREKRYATPSSEDKPNEHS